MMLEVKEREFYRPVRQDDKVVIIKDVLRFVEVTDPDLDMLKCLLKMLEEGKIDYFEVTWTRDLFVEIGPGGRIKVSVSALYTAWRKGLYAVTIKLQKQFGDTVKYAEFVVPKERVLELLTLAKGFESAGWYNSC